MASKITFTLQIRDYEHKILEYENKNEKIEDELKFQQQILSGVTDEIRSLRGVG